MSDLNSKLQNHVGNVLLLKNVVVFPSTKQENLLCVLVKIVDVIIDPKTGFDFFENVDYTCQCGLEYDYENETGGAIIVLTNHGLKNVWVEHENLVEVI